MKKKENYLLISSLTGETPDWKPTLLTGAALNSFLDLQQLPVNTHEANQAVNPFKMACLLKIVDQAGTEYTGTGFFIAPRRIITAGHCIHIDGQFAHHVTVIPGGNRKLFGSMTSNHFETVKGWAENSSHNYDYGAIILSDNSLFNMVGSAFEYEIVKDPGQVLLSGFPQVKAGEQWMSQGNITGKNPFHFFHDMPTAIGSSGSPILIDDGAGRRVIGLHTYGDSQSRYGVRITPGMYNSWKRWSQL